VRKRKYHIVEAGEWRAPRRRGYRSACCDCGLVHRMNFRLHRDKSGRRQIQVQAFRDNRATAGVRRGMKLAEWTGVLHVIKRKLGRRAVPVLIFIKIKTKFRARKKPGRKKR